MSTIGFVGLGSDGQPDRRPAARRRPYGDGPTAPRSGQPLIERGLVWRDTPREVAAAADVVFSMVTDDAALDAITRPRTESSPGWRAGRSTST